MLRRHTHANRAREPIGVAAHEVPLARAAAPSRRLCRPRGALALALAAVPAAGAVNTAPPASPVKLVFIHHSTGQAWLDDGHGRLGIALRDNGYFVSDTNYGWGPDSIGDTTDIGHWWTWFRGPSAGTYMTALYAESGQNCSYSRLATDPGGANEIVLFKSCFPNSQLSGSDADPVPLIADNPLKGLACGGACLHGRQREGHLHRPARLLLGPPREAVRGDRRAAGDLTRHPRRPRPGELARRPLAAGRRLHHRQRRGLRLLHRAHRPTAAVPA